MKKVLAIAVLVVLVGAGIIAVAPVAINALSGGTVLAQEGVSTPTLMPTAVIPTDVPTEAPTAASTEAPTMEPTAMPTEVSTVAPTPEPTADPNEGLTEVTLQNGTTVFVDLGTDWKLYPTAAMAFEFDSKVVSADNPRPENRYEPYDFVLQPGETILVFSEGSYTFADGTTFKAIGDKGIDNLVFVTNSDTVAMTFQLTGYASTGFSVIHFAPGAEPNVELWSRYGIGRPTHCGIAGLLYNGCVQNTARDVTWSVGKADVQEFVYTEALPVDNTALTAGESNSDWAQKSAAQAVLDEEVLRDQDPEILGKSAKIGVTYSKPIILTCTSGTIEGPKGTQTTDMPAVNGMSYTIVLWNNVGNTAVYNGTDLVGCTMYEYAGGNIPHPELYARASIGFNGVTQSTVYIMTYDLLDVLQVGTKVDEPVVFDTPLVSP